MCTFLAFHNTECLQSGNFQLSNCLQVHVFFHFFTQERCIRRDQNIIGLDISMQKKVVELGWKSFFFLNVKQPNQVRGIKENTNLLQNLRIVDAPDYFHLLVGFGWHLNAWHFDPSIHAKSKIFINTTCCKLCLLILRMWHFLPHK
jgi:hypothetical protein